MDDSKNLYVKISQKAVIYDPSQDKFLVVKQADNESPFFKNYGPWEFPGGRLEKDEVMEDAFRREIKEEVGDIEYEIKNLVGRILIKGLVGQAVVLGYLAILKGGEIILSDEHSEFRWVSAEEIAKNKEYKPWLKEFIAAADEYIQLEKSLGGWQRCVADFENYKKRQSENMAEMIKYSNQSLIMEILPVIDNFHASTDHVPEDQKDNAWVVGIMHIQKQLEKVLSDNGVEEIPVKVGDTFNPEIHEAIHANNIANGKANKANANKIEKIILKGYKIDGKVIRAARVIVE